MTQQALRELVALAEKHIRVANSDAPYSVYEANKEILVGTLVDAIPALKALLGEQREAQGADLTNLKKALIKQLSRDAYCHLGDQAELRKAAEDIGIFIKLSKEGPEEN